MTNHKLGSSEVREIADRGSREAMQAALNKIYRNASHADKVFLSQAVLKILADRKPDAT